MSISSVAGTHFVHPAVSPMGKAPPQEAEFIKEAAADQAPTPPLTAGSPLISSGVMETLLRLKETGTVYTQGDNRLLNSRQVSEADRQRFGEIFQDAVSNDGFNNPVQYIDSLSKEDLGVLQRVHSLGEPRAVTQTDTEGAVNLLLPPETVVDLNNDGLVNQGAVTAFHFPPPNTPQSVKDAWAAITDGMSFKERMMAETPFLSMALGANIRVDDQGRFAGVNEPNTPDYNNPFPPTASDWLEMIVGKAETYRENARLDPSLQVHADRFERFQGMLADILGGELAQV